MANDIRDGDGRNHESAKRYMQKAIAMFPELKASGYLKRIWQKIGA